MEKQNINTTDSIEKPTGYAKSAIEFCQFCGVRAYKTNGRGKVIALKYPENATQSQCGFTPACSAKLHFPNYRTRKAKAGRIASQIEMNDVKKIMDGKILRLPFYLKKIYRLPDKIKIINHGQKKRKMAEFFPKWLKEY